MQGPERPRRPRRGGRPRRRRPCPSRRCASACGSRWSARLDQRRLRRVVRARVPGETGPVARATLPRATLPPGRRRAPARWSRRATEVELATPRRGRRGRAAAGGRHGLPRRSSRSGRRRRNGLTVVNVVNLEDYLRGVVPNELSPAGVPPDRGAEGAGGRRAHLRARAPRGVRVEGLRRVRDAVLPGVPRPGLGAPAHATGRSRRPRASSRPGAAGRSTRTTPRPAAATRRTARRSSTTTRPT